MSHILLRTTVRWGSFGVNGDEPLTYRLICDLSDSHLNNIIIFLETHNPGNNMITLMKNEQHYRMVHGLTVREYEILNNFRNFKLGR